MRLFLLTIFYAIFCANTYAQSNLLFYEISLKEGLSHTSVHDIHRDYKGLLWIGTSFGLNRYDGKQIRQYFAVTNDSTSLIGNHIHFIQEDKEFNLWIGTDKSVVRYNRERDCFERPSEFKNLEYKSCYSLDDRIVFFEADRTVSYLYKEKSLVTNLYPSHIGKISLLLKIAKLDESTLLLATRWKGLFRYNVKTGELTSDKFHTSPQITAICVDRNERIWLSSYPEGLFAYSKEGELLKHYTSENSELSHNVVLDIQEVSNGDIWVATDGNGISILNEDLHFQNMSYSPDNPNFLPVNSISRIYEDNYQNIWIGTIRGGVIGTKNNFIQSYNQNHSNSNHGISERTVISLFDDKKGNIWIGTDGNGINRFDSKIEKFQHYPSTYKKKVTSIAKYSDHELLLSYYNEGLKIFNMQSGSVKDSPINLDDTESYGWISTSVKNINEREILIMGNKLYLYSKSSNKLITLNTWSKDSIEAGLLYINSSDSLIYLYSPTKIFSVNLQRKSISFVTDISKKIGVKANAIVQDIKGHFWIASEKGLWKYDSSNDEYLFLENNHFKRLTSLALSPDSLLWIGSPNKIYCFHTEKYQFWEYDASDGVEPNIYIPKATCRSEDDHLYFGGVNGFQRIKVADVVRDSSISTIEPIELLLNGELFTAFSYNSQKGINLPPTNQTIDLRLIVKTKYPFNQKAIRYKLEGVTNDYIITTDPTIRFTKVLPGEYTLKAQVYDGEWNKNPILDILTINVLPFWWQTWWFKTIIVGLLLILLYVLWLYYQQKQAKAIELKMSAYEKEMSEEKIRFLININHELRTPLTLITAPIERLLKNEKELPQKIQKPLNGIYKQARQMRNVIDMVLDIRKMELTRNELTLFVFDFNLLVKEILDDFQMEYLAKEVELQFKPANETPLMVKMDKSKCHKIVNNLIINALKFSSQYEKVTVEIKKEANKVVLFVIDEGIGLSQEDIDKIFIRFYQSNHNLGGSGIGLSYSKTLAEMMGGTISCKANETKGATFWVEIPINVEQQTNQKLKRLDDITFKQDTDIYITEVSDKDYSILKEYVILIIEDQIELNEYLKQELSPYFKKVHTAQNGSEGLRITMQYMPDCIISDIMMPEMNGYEFCQHLKTTVEISHIPLVLLTARADEHSAQHGYKVGADAYLTKPFSIEALLNLTTNMFFLRLKMQEAFRKSGYIILPEEINCNNEEERFLKKILQIVEDEISNPELDVDMLANKMALSRSTLYAKMKSLSGTGVKDFINEIRIKKAMVLLQETNLQIVEISEKVGYSQQRYFSTVFKQYTQMTPTQYRQEKCSAIDSTL